jgi:hypothetical protein
VRSREDVWRPKNSIQSFKKILASERLWLPLIPQTANSAPTGPDVSLRLRYSDLFPEVGLKNRYWEALKAVPVTGAIGFLGDVNRILGEGRSHDPEVNRQINERLIPAGEFALSC